MLFAIPVLAAPYPNIPKPIGSVAAPTPTAKAGIDIKVTTAPAVNTVKLNALELKNRRLD